METVTQYSVLLVERAIVGLFRLTSLIVDKVWPTKDVTLTLNLNVPSSPQCVTSCTLLWTLLEGFRHLSHSQLQSRLCLVLYP